MTLLKICPVSLSGSSYPPQSDFDKACLLKELFQAGRATATGVSKTLLQPFSFFLNIYSSSLFSINFSDMINLHK